MENEQTMAFDKPIEENKLTLAKFGKALLWATIAAIISGFVVGWFAIWIGSFYKITIAIAVMVPLGIGRTKIGKRGIAAAFVCGLSAAIAVVVMGLVIFGQGYYIEDEDMNGFLVVGAILAIVMGIWIGFSKDKSLDAANR